MTSYNTFSSDIIAESKKTPGCFDYTKLCIVESSPYSCLMPAHAKRTAEIIEHSLGKPPTTFIDATANIGCDTINFCNKFNISRGISIEVNKDAYECLKKNIEAFINTQKASTNKYFAFNENCLDFIKGFKLQTDFVYFDPPWGGPDYWKEKKLSLALEHNGISIPIHEVVNFTFDQKFTDMVVVKLPSNYDQKAFSNGIRNAVVTKHSVYKKKKKQGQRAFVAYFIVVCKRSSL